ncbi:MAG: SpoVA/SpoVAEb family sporulation membrane protein [Clostridia bacterium]|nr:SpoVA/SpoVAEb family sporulation membrane protein [Clostridia bacterium]
MNITRNEYKELYGKASPKSPKFRDFLLAFLVGGGICTVGQLLFELYLYLELKTDIAKALVPISLIFLSALFTSLHIFDKLAKHAGAGTLVPITGFANAVVSPAIEFKADERDIIGLSRKAP